MTMNRITMHHSAGGHKVNSTDKKHYHRIVGGDGVVVPGNHAILDNAPGRPFRSGGYAAHTLNLNSGNIGLSMAAMLNAKWSDPRSCPVFPTPRQIDAMLNEATRLCLEWNIEPSRRFLLSHAEVEITLGVKQRGKWDFDFSLLGPTRTRDPVAVGDELRAEVARRLAGRPRPAPAPGGVPVRPLLAWGSEGKDVEFLQRVLRLKVDGKFGPKTHSAVVAFQRANSLLPDGKVGPLTWKALGA